METLSPTIKKIQTVLNELGITSLDWPVKLSAGSLYHILSKNKLSKNIIDKICTLYRGQQVQQRDRGNQ
jgi:hypothetical protein